MNFNHAQLHEKAINISSNYLKYEAMLVSVLQELDLNKTYLHYEQASLYVYCINLLKLSESATYALISIARKSVKVPELKQAIEEKRITLTNARRIVPVITQSNKDEWLTKTASLSPLKLERALAQSFPDKVTQPTKFKYKSDSTARLETDVPVNVLDLLKRAQEILSQKNNEHVDVPHALEAVLKEFVERHDPVQKAARAKKEMNARQNQISRWY
jgi:hypothetical protein